MFSVINDGMSRIRLGLRIHADRFGVKATAERISGLQRELDLLKQKFLTDEAEVNCKKKQSADV